MWFLRAFVADSEPIAADALCGGSNDKGVDAVLIDDGAKTIFLVQGKYRTGSKIKSEKRADLISFAALSEVIFGDGFHNYKMNLSPLVLQKLEAARSRVAKNSYKLKMFYVTLGKCSVMLRTEAQKIARQANAETDLQVFDEKGTILLLADYLDGVAPPVPSLDLEFRSGKWSGAAGVFNRYDNKTDIDSWIFSMTDVEVAGLYEQAGVRLFARNIRGNPWKH